MHQVILIGVGRVDEGRNVRVGTGGGDAVAMAARRALAAMGSRHDETCHWHAVGVAVLVERVFPLADLAATERLGADMAKRIATLAGGWPSHPLRILLSGDLGAGKTTLVRAMLHALGYAGRVKSPTYTLCEPYDIALATTVLRVYHFDLYRFNRPQEWVEAGFDALFSGPAEQPTLCLVEWPQQAAGLLGTPDIELTLQSVAGDDVARRVIASAHTAAGEKMRPCV